MNFQAKKNRVFAFKVVMIGLDGAGKSTLIQYLKPNLSLGEKIEVMPTVGFRMEIIPNIIQIKKPVLIYDCSG